uniref:flagellin N-terminal helical domain-containing protein n=1 Tax=Pararhizobium sp. IMCC3301 TaxID=3067904 RepID=UPI002740ED41|nr:flagellin [Pararhizobium sp. IMCC3301]
MGSDITLSRAVRGNLLSLQSTSDLLTKTQERLSTGLKVNSALDNPTNFFTASSLNSRASDLSRLLDSVGNATQTLEAADNGISAITDLVEAAQATARQALQTASGITGGTDVAASLAGTGASLLADAAASVAGSGAALLADAPATVAGTGATLLPDAAGTVTGTADTSALTATAGDLVINGTTITFAGTENQAAILSAINAETGTTGVTATVDGSNQLVLTGADADTDVDIGAGSTGGTLTELGLSAGNNAATNLLSQGFSANETLELTVGSGSLQTITFGNGAGQVSTLAELNTALGSVTGATASVDSSGNLSVVGSNNEDSITVGGTSNSALLGTTDATTTATNLLSQGFAQGETLQITVGSGSVQTITFGTDGGSGEVSTLAELTAALGGITGATASIDANGNLSVLGSNTEDSITIGGTSNSALLGTSDATTSATNLLSQGFSQNQTLDITIGSGSTQSIVFGTGIGEVSTLAELDTALGALTDVTASVDSSGNLSLTAASAAASDSIVVGGTSDSSLLGTTDGTTAATVTGGTNRRESLENDFNELLVQIDQLKNDAGFNGKNLLDGDDLKVIFNEDGSSSMTIGGVSFDSAGLGLSAVATGAFDADSAIEATLASLDTATSTLRTQASKFGSNLSVVETRENFTKETINTLETGAANLTLADLNEEGANLLSLQTRQSLSSTALSLASQADQNVLRLL